MRRPRLAQLVWLGQAALIVLPVVALSGVALHLLHEDRTAIEQDAKSQANSIAPEVARRLGEQISAFLADARKNGTLTEAEILDYGREVYAVPDYPRWPAPNGWPAHLPTREAQLWQAAQDARFQHPNADAAARALTALAAPGNSKLARANAQLGLLIAAEPKGDSATWIRQAVAVARQYPDEVTESGTPVADLALLVALRHNHKGDVPQDLVSASESIISLHPSWLSTDLLDALDGAVSTGSGRRTAKRLRETWLQQEATRVRTRRLMETLRWRGLTQMRPTAVLFSDGETDKTKIERTRMAAPPPRQGLALSVQRGAGWKVTLVSAESLLRALHLNLPDYMGASLNLNNERWQLGEQGPAKLFPLAWAYGSFSMDGNFPFQLVLDLRKPEVWYAPYRRRLLLTQGLIISAVLAALLGLWRLWHTYRDQTRLSEMKSNLVSSVSHELRAPLAAVRLMVESLESGRVHGAEKQNDYYRLIARECRRLSSLVENVLDFSRIDQGRKQYHPEPLDALALLRHTVMLMEPGASEHQVRLRLVDPPPEFETLQPSWDSEAVEQSIVNLVDNAIKHSPAAAEVTVEVELMPTAVRIWIADQGPGIPAEEQQKIFDLFYRYGSELRRETEGVGIGLSIVKHVAEAHGGRVLVESAVGRGSRFGLELPR